MRMDGASVADRFLDAAGRAVARATTEAEAVGLARELYGLEVAAKALPGEYDDNFHLTTLYGTTLHELSGRQRERLSHFPIHKMGLC